MKGEAECTDDTVVSWSRRMRWRCEARVDDDAVRADGAKVTEGGADVAGANGHVAEGSAGVREGANSD